MRPLIALGIAGVALLLVACADADEAPPPTTSPTVPATVTTAATTEPTIMAEEEKPEKVLRCCSSPRVSGGDLEVYGSDIRSPINATFYFWEKIQSYKLVRTDEQSIDEAECRENRPLRTDSGHLLSLVDIKWEARYQLIPYESDDCSGPTIESYSYPLTFFGRGLIEDYSGRRMTYYEPYTVVPHDPSLSPDRLRVVGIGCLEVRSAPIFEAEVLECVPEGELLWTSDDDEEWNVDGLSWRQVKRSEDGRTEYAELRYLQGAETSPRGELKRRGGGDFVVVYGFSDSCLNLREGPGYHADVVDCVPAGTGLPGEPRHRVSADFAVWRPLEWEGQWVWADERHLLELGDVSVHEYWSTTATAGELAAAPVDLPDDVALVGFATVYEGGGYGSIVRSMEIIRVRKGPNGELIKETLFSPEETDPLDSSGYIHGAIATSDLSRIVVAAGHTLYESIDGGVSWTYLDDLEAVWPGFQLRFLPGENDGDPERVLSVVWWKHGNEDTVFTTHPAGERETLPPFEDWDMSRLWQLSEMAKNEQENPLPDLTPWDDNFAPNYWFSDDELLGVAQFRRWALAREGLDVAGDSCCSNHEIRWPAIYDLDTQLIRALALPDVFHLDPYEGSLWTLWLQRGPFLRVSLPGDCKNVRAEPGLDAEILDCAAEGVLLQDLNERAEDGGRIWLKVRTPAGIEGWSSSRYLE